MNPRSIFTAILALAAMMSAMMLEGGHVSSLLQLTALVLVGGVTFGLTVAQGPVVRTDRGTLVRRAGRGFLFAAPIGLALGLLNAVVNYSHPEQIGPSVALAMVSTVYGFFGYLICLMLRQSGGQTAPASLDLGRVGAGLLVTGATVAAASYVLDPKSLLVVVSLPALMFVIAGVVLANAQAGWSPVKWTVEKVMGGAVAGGVIGAVTLLIHVLENLDKPDTILLGVSIAAMPLLYAAITCIFVMLGFRIKQEVDHETAMESVPYGVCAAGLMSAVMTVVLFAVL